MDYKILYALVQNFKGGPVGLDSIGVAISENPRTVEEVIVVVRVCGLRFASVVVTVPVYVKIEISVL